MSGRETRYCNECGNQLRAGVSHCGRCGAAQPPKERPPARERRGRQETRQPRQGARQTREQRRGRQPSAGRRGRDNSTSGVVILVAALGVGFFLLIAAPVLATFVLGLGDSVEDTDVSRSQPEDVVESFLQAALDDDPQDAREQAHSDSPVAAELDDGTGGFSFPSDASDATVVDSAVVEEGDERTVIDAEVRWENSERTSTELVTVELRREGDQWKVWTFPYR